LLVTAALVNGRDGAGNPVASGFSKTGPGTMTLTAPNAYTGTTSILGGELRVGAAGSTGTLGTGAVVNQATLVFDRGDVHTVANAISGTGVVRKEGSGTLTLSGTSDYTGETIVNSGTLALSGSLYNNGLTAGVIRVNDGGIFRFDKPNAFGTQETNPAATFVIHEGGVVSSRARSSWPAALSRRSRRRNRNSVNKPSCWATIPIRA
jgi:autotransporter-associated beta strand protein